MPPMTDAESVTLWIHRLKAGDPGAAQKLYERYFRRLVGLARKKLQDAPRGVADEEDVASEAFWSFCHGAEHGRFPQLFDRNDLWQVLMVLTVRKAINQAKHGCRQKRGGPGPAGAAGPEAGAAEDVLDQLAGPEPTPEFAAQVADECRRLLAKLGDAELRAIAVWKMEGHTTAEIAARLGRAPRTVERRLQLIRKTWQEETLS
jgi:DNA-directed RNA polymerase specialized sigma24 family protein